MGNPAGVRRDFAALERRRMEAARLLRQGLSQSEVRDLERALKRGPEAFGFASGLWTASRVRAVIEYRTGVRYHEDHVWRILRKLNWSCQRPTGKALERDEQAIRQWQRVTWPRIKK